jgi:UDP-N-acetylglucosamine 2-epimerase (non-hydrolysing)
MNLGEQQMKKPILHGVVGTRPNMMKMAPLARALAGDGTFALRLIHTGQHYDEQMSEVFFRELGLPAPVFNLHTGSGTQGQQTAKIIEGYERVLFDETPRGLIVVGDVTSTMACTLAAAKLNIPVAHVEAGLRSFDRTMPEEINRMVTDALAEILFASDPAALVNLAREGHSPESIKFVGNIMIDNMFHELGKIDGTAIVKNLGLEPKRYVYLTMHRPSNVDEESVLRPLMDLFAELSSEISFIFAVHPRTRKMLTRYAIKMPEDRFRLVEPLGYRQSLCMIKEAFAVLTDSGGMQEESSVLNVPCLTLRWNTERPVTVDMGSSELVGNDVDLIREAWRRLIGGGWKKASLIPLWDGQTAPRIVRCLVEAWA